MVAEFRDPIYPGLVSTGKVERGGDKPFHTVINAENYHALQTLLFTHRGKVDCIYIDPPYNTGARDWKYNNDYVDGDDLYRHSKWLAFMERRLLLAKELLNPDDSVLIVTIDEKEYLRLGLLLEQMFPDARIQMVSIGHQSSRGERGRELFAESTSICSSSCFGAAAGPFNRGPDWQACEDAAQPTALGQLIRSEYRRCQVGRPGCSIRSCGRCGGSIQSVGDALHGAERDSCVHGTVAVWPIREDGSEGRWQVGPDTLGSCDRWTCALEHRRRRRSLRSNAR